MPYLTRDRDLSLKTRGSRQIPKKKIPSRKTQSTTLMRNSIRRGAHPMVSPYDQLDSRRRLRGQGMAGLAPIPSHSAWIRQACTSLQAQSDDRVIKRAPVLVTCNSVFRIQLQHLECRTQKVSPATDPAQQAPAGSWVTSDHHYPVPPIAWPS